MTRLKPKRIATEGYSPGDNVVQFQPVGSQTADAGCTAFTAEEGLQLMKVFAVLKTPKQRMAVIRFAKRLAAKK